MSPYGVGIYSITEKLILTAFIICILLHQIRTVAQTPTPLPLSLDPPDAPQDNLPLAAKARFFFKHCWRWRLMADGRPFKHFM